MSINEEQARDEIQREAQALLDAERAAEQDRQQAARELLEQEARAVAEANERNPLLPSLRADPLRAALILLERYFTKNNLRQLIYYRENWYSYFDRLWGQRHEQDVEHFIHSKLINCRTLDAEGEVIDFPTTNANVVELRKQIQNIQTIPTHYKAPVVRGENGRWIEIDPAGKMVCRGALVDMLSGEVNDNHSLFIPNGAEWEYKKKTKKPAHWLKFLHDLFGNRIEEINLLQEWFGYVLGGDTWAQKGLIIQGLKRSGKGTIGHILKDLLGGSMVASPALSHLGHPFGLESLVDKRMCLVSDARLSNRQDTMAVIEMLLRIIANDPVDINRKHKSAIQMVLGARVMLLTNTMPQFSDDSDAIQSRFMILKLEQSFYGREDIHLLDKLRTELPAIANWAIEGYRRVKAAGRFSEPESSRSAREEWYRESNPLLEFIEDRCEMGAEKRVENGALFDAYKDWCESKSIQFMPPNVLSRRLSSMYGALIRRGKTDSARFWTGIGLRTDRKSAF